MTAIHRIRVALTGFIGAPGVNTFYALDAPALVEPLHAYYAAIISAFPDDVHVQIEGSGDILTDTTGVLTGAWGPNETAPLVGTSSGNYLAPAGWCVNWLTNDILDGKHVKGRTFHVPAAADIGSTNGTLNDLSIPTLSDAANALTVASAGNMVVWHRPRLAQAADGSRKAVTARDGGHAIVLGAQVRDKIAVLRSRRD